MTHEDERCLVAPVPQAAHHLPRTGLYPALRYAEPAAVQNAPERGLARADHNQRWLLLPVGEFFLPDVSGIIMLPRHGHKAARQGILRIGDSVAGDRKSTRLNSSH